MMTEVVGAVGVTEVEVIMAEGGEEVAGGPGPGETVATEVVE